MNIFKDKNNLLAVLSIVFLAILAGAIGGIFIQNFFTSESGGLTYSLSRVIWRSPAEDLNRLRPQVAPMVVKLYRHIPIISESAGINIKNSYFSDDLAGEALTITADGWLVTADPGTDFTGLRAVAYDRKSYKVEKYVRDNFSKLVFLKINAENLLPSRFGKSADLSGGDYLFLADDEDNLIPTSAANPYFYSETKNDLVRSSDRLNRFVVLKDNFRKNLMGAPIFNIRGEAVAIFADNNNLAIPLEVVNPILSSFLKNGAVVRPALGAYYVNLSLLRNQDVWQKLKTTNGAYLWRSGDYPFAAKSAGFSAGLREGDIIVKIESEALNARRDLAEIISEYEAGTKLNFGIIRDGKEMTVAVTLK